jgi:signal transduction histidine kinase
MSHELRTPLNAIGGYVQLLEMEIHGTITDAQRGALSRVARSQAHLLRLINDVLDLARIEAGRVDYVLEEVSIGAAIANVTPMVEPQFEAKGVDFSVNAEANLIAHTDLEKLQQILINLLGNAVKFTPTGGRVRVEACRSADSAGQLEIRVVDTGIGIAPEKLDLVFRPFEQVDEHDTANKGSGLGLAISRDLARGMGGDLVVSSRSAGSTFTLTLPAAIAAE